MVRSTTLQPPVAVNPFVATPDVASDDSGGAGGHQRRWQRRRAMTTATVVAAAFAAAAVAAALGLAAARLALVGPHLTAASGGAAGIRPMLAAAPRRTPVVPWGLLRPPRVSRPAPAATTAMAAGEADAEAAAAPPPGKASGKPQRCALLMDSDAATPALWGPAQEAVRGEGALVATRIYIAAGTGYSDDSDWGRKLSSLGIEAKVVPAEEAGLELCTEAMRLVTEERVEVIALAVKESDFGFLADNIRQCQQLVQPPVKFSIIEIGLPA